MKKIVLLTAFCFCFITHAKSQEVISISDTLRGWEYSWVAGLNGSQAAYSNWAQGGVNTVSATGNSLLTAKYKKNRFAYGVQLNTRYGKSSIEDEGTRKTDDRLSIRNRFLYDLTDENSVLKLFGNINFRTQFDKGFEYGAGPDDSDILISKFFAPAYFNQSAGLAYLPNQFFSVEAGLGLQQTFVTDTELGPIYGLDPGDDFRSEGGLTFVTSFQKTIATNLSYSTSLETFTNLNKSVSSTDIIFANQITGKINNLMNASVRFDLAFDDDFSDEVQVAQVLSIGISFILF